MCQCECTSPGWSGYRSVQTLDILHPDSLLLPGPPARNATSMSATATGGGVNDILHATQLMPARARQPVITSLEALSFQRLMMHVVFCYLHTPGPSAARLVTLVLTYDSHSSTRLDRMNSWQERCDSRELVMGGRLSDSGLHNRTPYPCCFTYISSNI